MKHSILLLFLLAHLTVFGQAPDFISYQGVARDNGGNVLVNQSIGLQLSILEGNSNGAVVFSETHAPTTNDFGLFTIQIGNGTLLSGSFSNIDWGAHPHFLKVEMDATGGSNYAVLGTSQLVSVPYALHANTADSIVGGTQRQNVFRVANGSLQTSSTSFSAMASGTALINGPFCYAIQTDGIYVDVSNTLIYLRLVFVNGPTTIYAPNVMGHSNFYYIDNSRLDSWTNTYCMDGIPPGTYTVTLEWRGTSGTSDINWNSGYGELNLAIW